MSDNPFAVFPGRPVGGCNGINSAQVRYAQSGGPMNGPYRRASLNDPYRPPTDLSMTEDRAIQIQTEALHNQAMFRERLAERMPSERLMTAPHFMPSYNLENHFWNGHGEFVISPTPYTRVDFFRN